MKQLVKGDDRPASDLDTFEADLADKISQRIAGEQNIFEARQDLGLAMGLAYEAIDDLPLPKDTFPDPRKNKSPLIKLGPVKLFEKARNNRADYLSMKKREAEARILLVAATNNLLPQLDINGGIGYAGLEDGGNVDDYFKSIGNKLTGANYSAGITLTFPFGNNEAKGLHLQQRSRLRKAVIQTGNLERKIRSDIVVAFQAILRTSRELKETRRSVKHYRTAVSNERTKFGMGMASVLDVINIQNFLRNTMLSEVRKMNSYAAAVVDLRYQTGALITTHGDGYRVEMEQLISPPQVGGETR
jgi:outer membrane protein TolC